jgi:hypothetical protein
MQDTQCDTSVARRHRERSEVVGPADLFDEHCDYPRAAVLEDSAKVVLNTQDRFVPGRNGVIDRNVLGLGSISQPEGHRATLRDDRNARPVLAPVRPNVAKSERGSVDKVDQSQAIRACKRYLVPTRCCRKRLLLSQPRCVNLPVAGRENDDAADTSATGRLQGRKGTRLGDSKDRNIYTYGKVVDGRDTRQTVDLAPRPAHQVDLAGVFKALDQGERRPADRRRVVGRADYRYRFWVKQARKRRTSGEE